MNDTRSPVASSSQEVVRLGELIGDIRTCMMTTVDDDGALRSRPMATQERTFDGTLWFFTDAHSGKTAELREHSEVNLAYSGDGKSFVSVSGRASVVRDREKFRELWTPMAKTYFPEGVDDPNLALIRVEVDKAEYWNVLGGPVTQVLAFTKAIFTGQRQAPANEHAKLEELGGKL